MGRAPRIKKRAFRKRLKKSRHKKRTRRVLMESAVGIYFRRGKSRSFKASADGHSAPRKLRGRRKRLCAAKCLTSDFITSKHKKKNPKGSYGIRSRNLLPTRKKSKFQGFCRWNLLFLLLSFRQRLECNEPLTMRKQIIYLPDKR